MRAINCHLKTFFGHLVNAIAAGCLLLPFAFDTFAKNDTLANDEVASTASSDACYHTLLKRHRNAFRMADFEMVSFVRYFEAINPVIEHHPLALKSRSRKELQEIEMDGGQFYLNHTGSAGFAIFKDGEVFGVFNESEMGGIIDLIIRSAGTLGARLIRCIDDLADSEHSPCRPYRTNPLLIDSGSELFTTSMRPNLSLPASRMQNLRRRTFRILVAN